MAAMDKSERITFVRIIAQMLIADGALSDEERAHLDLVMGSLDLSKEERSEALTKIDLDSPLEDRVAELSEGSKKRLGEEVEKAMAGRTPTRSEAYFLQRVRALLE